MEFKSLFSFFFAYMNPDNVYVCVVSTIIVLCQNKVERNSHKPFLLFARDAIYVADVTQQTIILGLYEEIKQLEL